MKLTLPALVLLLLAVFFTDAQATPPLIVIDPGHGGTAVAGSLRERSNSSPNNATTPGGLKEKDLTLEFSLILRDEILLESKRIGIPADVLLTRETDVNLDFAQRAAICNRPDTACVVSIHFNAGGGPGALGSLGLVAAASRNPDYEIDRRFAEGLAAACSEGVRHFLPTSRSRGVITDGHLHGGLGSNFFFQLVRQPHLKGIPKCFLEVEFIDNPAVEKALLRGDRAANFRIVAKPVAAYLLGTLEEPARRKE